MSQINIGDYKGKVSRPYETICDGMTIKTYRKRIFKTFSRTLAEYLVNSLGFELLAVTDPGMPMKGRQPGKKYTLYGVKEKLGRVQIQALKDGILKPMGYNDRDEEIVRIKREGKQYV